MTANLGSAIAKRGHKIALVDADFGLRNLDLLLGLENRVVYTAVEAIAGDCRIEQALVRDKRQPNLALLPAAQSRNKEAVNPEQMKKLVLALAEKFDYILVDCPAGIELGFRNAIAAAKEAILVTTPEVTAVRDADRVIGLLEANDITNIRLIINRLRPQMVQLQDMMSVEDVLEILAVPLLGVVPDDERIITSSNRGEPIALSEERSLPAIAFNNIVRRLEGEDVPVLDLVATYNTLFNRLRRWFRK